MNGTKLSLKLLLCLLASLSLPPVDSRGQTANAAARVSLGGENKRLKKLGVKLPASAVIETKFKDDGERQVHLFMKVPTADLGAFVKALGKQTTRDNRYVSLGNGYGYIPLVGHEAGRFSENWKETHSAKLVHVAYISLSEMMESGELKGRFVETDYVVLFADVKKGLMWVYYHSK